MGNLNCEKRQPIGGSLGEALLHAATLYPAEDYASAAISLLRRHADAVPEAGETLEWTKSPARSSFLRHL